MSVIENRLGRLIAGISKLREFKVPEDIARFLADLNYQGECENRHDCVVARFLRDCVGDPDANISVSPISITYVWSNDEDGKPTGENSLFEVGVKYESAFGDFLAGFDRHDYPALVDRSPAEEDEPAPELAKA